MGTGRHTSAISAGALALALGGGISILTVGTADAAVPTLDCVTGGGALSGVTNGLCKVVGGVTGTVSGLADTVTGTAQTAGATLSSTVSSTAGSTLSSTVDTKLGAAAKGSGDGGGTGTLTGAVQNDLPTPESLAATAGKAAGTAGETVAHTVADAAAAGNAALGEENARGDASSGTDRGVVPDGRCPAAGACAPEDTPASSSEEEAALPNLGGERGAGPGDLPVIPDRPGSVTPPDKPGAKPPSRVDPGELRWSLLWPGATLPLLNQNLRGERLAPPKPYDDALGTGLTAALLLSAVIAARVMSTRRARSETTETIPLEPHPMRAIRTGPLIRPARPGGRHGRHRLA